MPGAGTNLGADGGDSREECPGSSTGQDVLDLPVTQEANLVIELHLHQKLKIMPSGNRQAGCITQQAVVAHVALLTRSSLSIEQPDVATAVGCAESRCTQLLAGTAGTHQYVPRSPHFGVGGQERLHDVAHSLILHNR